MSDEHLVPLAASPFREVVHAIEPHHLTLPTPCAEYDVRALLDHLLTWGPPLEGAARKQSVPPAEPDPDWRPALDATVDRLVAAWGEPGAWEGVTSMGGSARLPAPMVGHMLLCEFVVHGWDLGKAIGHRVEWDQGLLRALLEGVARTAEQGRAMGAFGPEVPVPASAPLLDRLLGLTGRVPG